MHGDSGPGRGLGMVRNGPMKFVRTSLPTPMYEELVERAVQADRSLAAELRRAVSRYLAGGATT